MKATVQSVAAVSRVIAVADVGGTHARFAFAEVGDGKARLTSAPVRLNTADYPSFQAAWQQFGQQQGMALPREVAIAFAGPVTGDLLKLSNNPWVIRPAAMAERLDVDWVVILNDFGAIAHSIGMLPGLRHVAGPDRELPEEGIISVIGPGTGLGVAILIRDPKGYQVIETEGGHVDFAPLDELEDRILAQLRRKFGRVSIERIASGRGLWNLYEALGAIKDVSLKFNDERQLWAAALAGTDPLAVAALDRLCLTLGSVAGDFALAHGASAVVIAGGAGLRVAERLPCSGFHDRFVAKGRFRERISDIPVKLITEDEPGLIGAAAAFLRSIGRADR